MVSGDCRRAVSSYQLDTLPYHELGGPGLERLCFALLQSMGYEPRFFGRSGQRQHGVDLVAERGALTEVFQCKNLARSLTITDLQGYLDRFRADWLGSAALPRPNSFVIVCPQLLRDSDTDAAWISLRDTFQAATKVKASIWHLDLLNAVRRLALGKPIHR